MCTYLLLRDVFGPGTLAFAGNRDESLTRPFEDPSREDVAGIAALMPRDHLGGTWIGATRHLFAALTNAPRAGIAEHEPRRGTRSRGLLVRDALGHRDPAAAAAHVLRLVAEHEHDGFNLVLAGAGAALLVSLGADGARVSEVPPGIHALQHRAGGSVALPSLDVDPADPEGSLLRLAAGTLASHEPVAFTGHAPCRHEATRGTVATMLALHAPDPARAFLMFSRGPACQATFQRHDLGDR